MSKIGKGSITETVIEKLGWLSGFILELTSGLESGDRIVSDVPSVLMDCIIDNTTSALTLPDHNLTESKYHQNGYRTRQVCVIDNTEDNRKAIRQLNKLAKEQNSQYRFSIRYRKPKEGHKYGHGGELRRDNALGIGLYIEGAVPNHTKLYELNVANERIVELESQLLEARNAMGRYRDRCVRQDEQRSLLMFELVALKDKLSHVISNIL